MATTPFSGGTASIAGFGSWDRVIFSTGAAWTAGSTWTVAGTSAQGRFSFGIGFLGSDHTSGNYNTGLVMNRRVYIGQKDRVVFSSVSDPNNTSTTGPNGWNVQDTGAGFFVTRDQNAQQDTINGLAPFQGRLAVFGRYHIEVWAVSADPTQFQWVQTLSNIGTSAPRSVNGTLGDLDVVFIDDSGLRSLRTLVTTLNASMYDVGSAVDNSVQASLLALSDLTTTCSTIEPATKRYWVAVGSNVYVLSYYPQAKIQAWGIYNLTTPAQVGFNATWFTLVFGRVLIRGDNDHIYAYGGLTNNLGTLSTPIYDGCTITITTPWMDHKLPKVRKISKYIGAAFAGHWNIGASMQPSGATPVKTVILQGSAGSPLESSDSALDLPVFPYSEEGTRIQLTATSTTTGNVTNPTKLSLLEWTYDLGEPL